MVALQEGAVKKGLSIGKGVLDYWPIHGLFVNIVNLLSALLGSRRHTLPSKHMLLSCQLVRYADDNGLSEFSGLLTTSEFQLIVIGRLLSPLSKKHTIIPGHWYE